MDDLYLEHILDHFQTPRKKGELIAPTHESFSANASCGDTLQLQLRLDAQGGIQEVAWNGSGCAISQATASILAEKMISRNIAEFQNLSIEQVSELLGIEISPARAKCAMLFVRAVQQSQTKESL